MADNGEDRYVWAVEWENPFAPEHKRGMVFYDVTLLPGVTKEAFEKYLTEEALPAVRGILTRAIRFEDQYLMKDAGEDGPDPLDKIQKVGVTEKLGALCKHTKGKSFYITASHKTSSEE